MVLTPKGAARCPAREQAGLTVAAAAEDRVLARYGREQAGRVPNQHYFGGCVNESSETGVRKAKTGKHDANGVDRDRPDEILPDDPTRPLPIARASKKQK